MMLVILITLQRGDCTPREGRASEQNRTPPVRYTRCCDRQRWRTNRREKGPAGLTAGPKSLTVPCAKRDNCTKPPSFSASRRELHLCDLGKRAAGGSGDKISERCAAVSGDGGIVLILLGIFGIAVGLEYRSTGLSIGLAALGGLALACGMGLLVLKIVRRNVG